MIIIINIETKHDNFCSSFEALDDKCKSDDNNNEQLSDSLNQYTKNVSNKGTLDMNINCYNYNKQHLS